MRTTPDPSATYRQGLRALALEEIDEAVDLLTKAVADRPDHAEAHAYLGGALLAQGRVAAGQDAVRAALRLAPNAFAPNIKAGELALRLGDLERAERHFLQALKDAEPATSAARAAKALLREARRRRAASIAHQASLPSIGRLSAWWRHRRRVASTIGPTGAPESTVAIQEG